MEVEVLVAMGLILLLVAILDISRFTVGSSSRSLRVVFGLELKGTLGVVFGDSWGSLGVDTFFIDDGDIA